MQTNLMKMEYFDLKAETRLEAYADTAVIEKEGNASFIVAVRFGGYLARTGKGSLTSVP